MKYQLTKADTAPVPAAYATEPRYLGYRTEDCRKPHAKYFFKRALPVQPHVEDAPLAGLVAGAYGVRLRTLADELSKPGYLPLETGDTRQRRRARGHFSTDRHAGRDRRVAGLADVVAHGGGRTLQALAPRSTFVCRLCGGPQSAQGLDRPSARPGQLLTNISAWSGPPCGPVSSTRKSSASRPAHRAAP